jgi:hypothetical protein
MAKQTINLGSGPNASDGTPLRDAFDMVNDNFDELYTSKTALETDKEPTITGGTTGQYWRGDKTFQTLNKAAVGLGNVDNTSDASKPISTATQTALDAKVDEGSITTSGLTMTTARVLGRSTSGSGAVEELTAAAAKALLALNNVDNTADADKPVSSATQTALDSKANTSHTHVVGDINLAAGPRLIGKSTAGAGAATELTDVQAKSLLGLDQVNNTSDTNKPVSTATQTALDGKADTVHTHAIADVTGLQSALDNKAAASHTHTISQVTGLQTALDGKAALNHTHDITTLTGYDDAMDAKADAVHTHVISDVTGLQAELVHSVKAFLGSIVSNSRLIDISDTDFTVVISNSKVVAGVAATAETVFDINKNDVTIGTVTFEASGVEGTIDVPVSTDLDLVVGDVIELIGPSSADATLARVAMVFRN